MTKRKKNFLKGIALAIAVLMLAVVINISYNAGMDKGREETIEILNTIADDYNFKIWDNDGWTLGCGSNGEFYENSSDSLRVDYNWDDYKIRLSYMRR